jgi:hypothetical protein
MKRISSVLGGFLGLFLASQMAKADDDAAALIKAGEDYCLANAEEVKDFSDYYYNSAPQICYADLGGGNYEFVDYRSKRPNRTYCWDTTMFAIPAMQWAVPNSALSGPPAKLSSHMMKMMRDLQ